MDYIPRSLEEELLAASRSFPVILLTGPRQVGKSTLLGHLFPSHRYISFDDPILRSLARKDPALFLTENPPPLVLDEVQYVPEILSYIKERVDAKRDVYGQYLLTGSQSFSLMEGVSESLAGRIAILELYPFSSQEVAHLRKGSFLLRTQESMLRGGYPELWIQSQLSPGRWFGSYVNTYIERDLRNIQRVHDLQRFQTFLQLLSLRAGSLLNLLEVGKECGISHTTAKDWVSLLESTYVIYLLRPFSRNGTKRLVKSPKLYFVDTGLLSYLLGIDSVEHLQKSPFRGHIFENLVVMDVIKQLSFLPSRSRYSFYRTSSGVEVDLIVERGGALFALEIKYSEALSPDMALSIEKFREEYPFQRGAVLSLRPSSVTLSQGVEAIYWEKGCSLEFFDKNT